MMDINVNSPRRREGCGDARTGCCTGTGWANEIPPAVRERVGELYTGKV